MCAIFISCSGRGISQSMYILCICHDLVDVGRKKPMNITLRHALQPLGEKHLGYAQLWTDGFHAETNSVYSFYCFLPRSFEL